MDLLFKKGAVVQYNDPQCPALLDAHPLQWMGVAERHDRLVKA